MAVMKKKLKKKSILKDGLKAFLSTKFGDEASSSSSVPPKKQPTGEINLPVGAGEAASDLILNADYWRSLVPFLSVHGKKNTKDRPTSECDGREERNITNQLTLHKSNIQDHGYTLVDDQEILDQHLIDKLSFAASILEYYNWPTTFLAIYDETWLLAQQCQDWMTKLTDNRNKFCMDIVGFNVVDGVGFSPHRDRQPEDWQPKGHLEESPEATFDAGYARYITCWCALSDAHPGNSCMHYVSAKKDPGYFAGDSEDGDPMNRCFGEDKSAFQHIRATPVKKGGFVAHTHRVIHWGNQGDRDESREGSYARREFIKDLLEAHPSSEQREQFDQICQEFAMSKRTPKESGFYENILSIIPENRNRVAISFAFSNNGNYPEGGECSAFEPPYVQGKCATTTDIKVHEKKLRSPNFETRAGLCSAQVLNYSPLSVGDPRGWMTLAGKVLKRPHMRILYDVFKKVETHFAAHYRKEIRAKFVALMLGGNGNCNDCKKPAKDSKETEQWATVTRETTETTTTESPLKSGPKSDAESKTDAKPAEKIGSKKRMDDFSDDSDLEDDALLAMLDAEKNHNSVLFHDDFDVLAHRGDLGKLPNVANRGKKKKVRRKNMWSVRAPLFA